VNPKPATEPSRILTDRIVDRLPLPRWLAIVLWVAVLGLQAAAYEAIEGGAAPSRLLLDLDLPDLAVGGYLIAMSLVVGSWLAGRAVRQVAELARLAPGSEAYWLRGLYATWVPVVLAAALTAAEVGEAVATLGIEALPLFLPAFVVHLPTATAVWTLIVVLMALDRVGRSALHLDPYSGDPNLGLKPLGSLAFSAYLLLVAGAAPVLLRFTTSAVALAINVPLFLLGTATFALALWRVHRKMHATRTAALEVARRRFAEAFAPLRVTDDAATLLAQAPRLSAAEALEKRIERIKTWPVTGGLVGQSLVITVSVVTGLVSRAVTNAIGL
jgi:hypothetical protein